MRISYRLILLGMFVGSLLAGAAPGAWAQDPVSNCTNDPATNTTTCRIDNPLVTQRMTEYDGAFHPELFEAFGHCSLFGCNQRFGVSLPGIFLAAGDLITLDADGCVQTGGSGDTWKRYLNPQGDNADRLYHGLLGVRNVIKQDGTMLIADTRIQDIRLQPLWVPAVQVLRLGYEDDNYDDNGYWGHDNGDPEQCNLDGSHGFGGNAFVILTIQHNQPRPSNAPPQPWDITTADPGVADPFDINALLFNPRWGWQTKSTSEKQSFDQCLSDASAALHCGIFDFKCLQSALAACVSQPLTEDGPDVIFNSLGPLCGGGKGHTNWTIVSYHGPLFWEEYSGPFPNDDDYNFVMNTPVTNGFPSGITKDNGSDIPGLEDDIRLEFEAQETIDHFGLTPFWNDFHRAVDTDRLLGTNFARAMVGGNDAVAIGLLGLDRVHGSASEIHPVFVLAIHVKADPMDDEWAIFARNYGNEGFCSDNMHYADFNTVTLQLPRPASVPATSQATVASGTRFFSSALLSDPGASFPGIDIFPAQAVGIATSPRQDTFITFHLPPTPNDGDDGDRISGELHLQWSGAAGPAPAPVATQPREATSLAAATSPATDPEEPEAKISALFAQLTSQQQATALSLAGVQAPVPDDNVELVPTFLNNPPSRANTPATPTAVLSPRQQQRWQKLGRGLCGALNGQLPANIGTCDSFPPFTQLTFTGTPNAAGWFNTPVTITLTPFNVSGKGIDHTEYSFDGQNWISYASPFVLSNGIVTLFYRSEDLARTFEPAEQRTLKIDTTPPVISCSASPNVLWPPNHEMRPVQVAVNVSDNFSGVAGFSLVSVLSSEPALTSGSGNTNSDTANWEIGTPDLNGSLRAERSGSGRGRTYTLVYSARDLAGNQADCRTTVSVPHSQ